MSILCDRTVLAEEVLGDGGRRSQRRRRRAAGSPVAGWRSGLETGRAGAQRRRPFKRRGATKPPGREGPLLRSRAGWELLSGECRCFGWVHPGGCRRRQSQSVAECARLGSQEQRCRLETVYRWLLRQPRFQGLPQNKDPAEVVREIP